MKIDDFNPNRDIWNASQVWVAVLRYQSTNFNDYFSKNNLCICPLIGLLSTVSYSIHTWKLFVLKACSQLASTLAIAHSSLVFCANDLHNKYTILNLHNRVLIPLAYPSMELILLAHIHQCQVFYQKLKCTMKVTSHSMGMKNTDGSFHHFSMLLLHKS